MKRVLADIQSGRFARDWVLENKVGQATFKAMRKQSRSTRSRRSAPSCARMMPWIKEASWSTRPGTDGGSLAVRRGCQKF